MTSDASRTSGSPMSPPRVRPKTLAISAYAATGGISILAATVLLKLPKADLHVPFDYGGDALYYSSVIKSVVEHGWFWRNPSVGAPGGLELYDYPNVAHESLHLLTIKMMSAFSGDWALLLNVYFLLGFPLIALSAMAVFRHFRVGYGPAIVGSVLYSFLPTRLLKGEGHVFLDVFYQVPLAILVLLWVCSDSPPFVSMPREGRWPWFELRRRRTLAALLICGLNACTSAYYAFFAICLLLAGGAWASIERRSIRNAVSGVSLAAAIVVGMAANGLPSMVYHLSHGRNEEVGRRGSFEAEVHGMKIAQLLLPAAGHRLSALRWLHERYTAGAPLVGENGSTSLGLVGDVGFLALLGAVLNRPRSERFPDALLQPLAVLNLCAVLLGTIGGFGSLFALLVNPQIRAYSRLGVLIGFFALFAVVLLLDRLARRHAILGALALPVVLAVGLLDQVTRLAVRPYATTKEAFASDRDLVRRIEARVPPGTVLFELPYLVFPEGPALHRLSSYDLLRPYLHSRALRWGLPTMRGRSGDVFARDLSQREPEAILETLAMTGFGGILIQREGYVDDGAAIERTLRAALGADPLVSRNGRFAFFSLEGRPPQGNVEPSPAEIQRILHPLVVSFSDDFYGVEEQPNGTFRWCRRAGEIQVDNETAFRRRASMQMTFAAARSPARLTMGGDLVSASVEIVGAVPFAREIDVPPGHHVIQLGCDGEPLDVDDPRTLVFRLENFVFAELPATAGGSH